MKSHESEANSSPQREEGSVSIAAEYDLVADFAIVVAEPPPAHGTNIWWTDEDAAVWTARWSEMEPSHVRVPLLHALLEPENDNADPNDINWSGFQFETPITLPVTTTRTLTHHDWFEAMRDQSDLDILIQFSYLSPWLTDNPPHSELPIPAAPYPPNDLAEYREFVEAVLRYLVEIVEFPPERIAVEAMNEPDLACNADPVVPCFWDNWSMDDIASVVSATHEAIQAVDADISLTGLAECCGTDVVRELLDHYPEGDYLETLSFHYYSPAGFDLDPALNRAAQLAPYERPIYLDEYGSLSYLSEGNAGALWHSWALVTLSEAGIAPLQYPISEWPLLGEPYNSMGLFADWRGGWQPKPSYWTYVNFCHFVGGREIISHTAPIELDVLTTRQGTGEEAQASFWVVNRTEAELVDQVFSLHNFPEMEATLLVFDNMVGPTPTLTVALSGSPLVFTTTLPAFSSQTYILSAKASHGLLDHVVLTPSSATRAAGQPITYTLTAYDNLGNKWDVTGSGTYAISPAAGGIWTANVYTTERAGTWVVTGSYEDQSDSASLKVHHSIPDSLDLTPALATRLAGQVITYTLTAYDAYGNDWDATLSGTFEIETGAAGTWAGNLYTTEVTGTWTVTGSHYNQHDNSLLRVWAPPLWTYLPLTFRESATP